MSRARPTPPAGHVSYPEVLVCSSTTVRVGWVNSTVRMAVVASTNSPARPIPLAGRISLMFLPSRMIYSSITAIVGWPSSIIRIGKVISISFPTRPTPPAGHLSSGWRFSDELGGKETAYFLASSLEYVSANGFGQVNRDSLYLLPKLFLTPHHSAILSPVHQHQQSKRS